MQGDFINYNRQAVQEAARHLLPGDKALWVASWRSAGAEWTEICCSGLVTRHSSARLPATTRRGDLRGRGPQAHAPARGRCVGAPQPQAGANPQHASQRGGQGVIGGSQRRTATIVPLPCRPAGISWTPSAWSTAVWSFSPRKIPDATGTYPGVSTNTSRPSLPTVDNRTQLHDGLGRAHCGRGGDAGVERVVYNSTPAGTPAAQYAAVPLEGQGPHTRPRPTVIHGAGPERPWDGETTEWLRAAPKPHTGWRGDVSSLVWAPLSPRLVLHTANILRATEIPAWGRDAATVRWFPPEEGGTRLTVAQFKKAGPTYDDALSRLGNLSGPLFLMLPTDLTVALRREVDGQDGLRTGWETVADGALLALLYRGNADGCRWDALVPQLTGGHTYMTTAQGHPRPEWDDFIAAFHDHKVICDDTWQAVWQKTLSRDYRRRVRDRLLELRGPLH